MSWFAFPALLSFAWAVALILHVRPLGLTEAESDDRLAGIVVIGAGVLTVAWATAAIVRWTAA